MGIQTILRNYGQRDFHGLLGFTFFGFFLVLSGILSIECIVHQDYAWELTWILNGNGMTPVYFRWGAIPWRLFFIIGPPLELSLKTIILLSSLWFILTKFFTWLICHFYFQNKSAGILVLFSILLSHSEGFYAQGLQVYNASVYFCLLFAVITDEFNIGKLRDKPVLNYFVLVGLLWLIKETHVGVFLSCGPMLLYYVFNNFNWRKFSVVSIAGLYGLISTVFYSHKHEAGHLSSIKNAVMSKGWNELNGILDFFLRELIELNFLMPLLFFSVAVRFMVKSKMIWESIGTVAYAILFFILILAKLAAYDGDYPLSHDVDYYMEGATYTLLLIMASSFLFWYSKSENKQFEKSSNKVLLICIVIFYAAQITEAGVKHRKYNHYMKTLMGNLMNDYDDSLFVLNHRLIPYRFSKLNINVEYETLIKSNIWFGRSIVILPTPHDSLYVSEELEPYYVNSLPQFEKDSEINLSYNDIRYHFKVIEPNKFFTKLNPLFFNTENTNHRIVHKDYMYDFNGDYGFEISER